MDTSAPGPSIDGTFWELIEARAKATPDRVMIADDRGRQLTYGQFRDASERVAAGLFAQGVKAGTVVSWQLPTVAEAAVLKGALARLGAVQNPIIPILRLAEVTHIVGQAKTELLITPSVWRGFDYPAMAVDVAAIHGCRTMIVDHTRVTGDALDLPQGDPSALPAPPASATANDTRWIYYSSGTTAAPKGARHSDRSAMAGSNGIVDELGLQPDDVFPCAFPITHIGGHCFVTALLRTGARIVLFETFDVQRTPLAMAKCGATLLGSALPFFMAYLAAQKEHGSEVLYPKLRMCASGGAPSPPELHYQVKTELGGVGVIIGYGLTEFPIATYTTPNDPDDILANTVGRACRDVQVRIVGTDGKDVPTGEEGEIRLKGPQMQLGYVDAALDVDGFDEQRFFRTGDLGTMDAAGIVRVTGRLKDIIIRNAENISATEVENVLFTHPAVADVAVVGVPDPRTGERACAVIVLRPGAEALTLPAIAEHCRANGLSTQKIPERLDLVDVLPRNAMGKLLKQQIRADLLKG